MGTMLPGGQWTVDAPSKPLNTQLKIDQEDRVVVVVTYEQGIVTEFIMERNGNVTIGSRKTAEKQLESAAKGPESRTDR